MPKTTNLTIKQSKFIEELITCQNPTEAAMRIYNCKDRNSAAVIGHENLRKLNISLGETEAQKDKRLTTLNKAWEIVHDFLHDEKIDRNYRLQFAIDIVKRNVPQEIKGEGFANYLQIFAGLDIKRIRSLRDSVRQSISEERPV